MKELTFEAKIAILKILDEMIHADNIIHKKEIEYMNEIVSDLGLEEQHLKDIQQIVTLQALSVIRGLPVNIKQQIAQLMGKMIVVDENINYNEVKLYNTVCELCNIEKDFHVEDYPQYSLSGPFLNPEDLMNN